MMVKDLLARKGATVVTIEPGSTVADVVAALVKYRVGSLVVSGDGRHIDGIVSERDVVRGLNNHGVELLQMAVSDLMTANVLSCEPTQETAWVARTMTEHRFRHMPVTLDGVLYGIVSIGDLVKNRIDELETEQGQLVSYISQSG